MLTASPSAHALASSSLTRWSQINSVINMMTSTGQTSSRFLMWGLLMGVGSKPENLQLQFSFFLFLDFLWKLHIPKRSNCKISSDGRLVHVSVWVWGKRSRLSCQSAQFIELAGEFVTLGLCTIPGLGERTFWPFSVTSLVHAFRIPSETSKSSLQGTLSLQSAHYPLISSGCRLFLR